VGTKQLKQGAVTAKKVKNGTLVNQDFKAGQLPTGPQGPAGPRGATGAPGSVIAHADVSSNGNVFAPSANNITSANIIHTASTGVYCFQNLPFQRRSAMAASSGFFTGEEDTVVNVAIGYAGPDCPNSFTKPTTRVLTWNISLNGPRDRNFIIWFED
jgi:hypothetical protein